MALGMAIRVASGRIGAWAAAGAGLRTASRVACPAAPSIASGGAFSTATCDLTDAHMPDPVDRAEKSTSVRVVSPAMGFRDFGAVTAFHGQAVTISCFENNPLVREALMDEKGEGRVLVVDGGGSMRCALLGDMIAGAGAENGWSGVIIHGCVRDSAVLATVPMGIKALATHPLKSSKRDRGLRGVPVVLGDVVVSSGDYVYADVDGILISKEPLA